MRQFQKVKFDISTAALLKIALFVVGIIFLYYIRDILVLLFITLIIVAGLDPIVTKMESQKIPRVFSVLIAYLLLFLVFGALIYLIVPPLVEQIMNINYNLPYFADKISNFLNINLSDIFARGSSSLGQITNQLTQISGNVLKTVLALFGSFVSALMVLVLSFYLLLERKELKKFIFAFIPQTKKVLIDNIFTKTLPKLGEWIRGWLVLSITIGVANLIALWIIGVPYALSLAILAGFLEIVPTVGPLIAGAVAAIVALATGGWMMLLFVVIAYIIIQALENYVLVPKIMGKAVGLSPVIIIVALMIGAKLEGILGAIIAIPIAAVIIIVLNEWAEHNKLEKIDD